MATDEDIADWAALILENLDSEPLDVMSHGFVDESWMRGFHIPDPAPGNGIELTISEHSWRHGEEVFHVTDRAAFIESVGGRGGDLLRLVYTRNLMEE